MTKNKLLITVICLLFTIVLGVFLAWPQYQDLKSLQKKNIEKKTELQYKEEYFLNLKEISEELKQYPDSLSKIDSFLPSYLSLPNLFNFLQKMSSEYGLILKTIGQLTTSSLKEREKVQQHSLDLSLSGSYSSFKNFLSGLEKSARLAEVEFIYFSTPKEKLLTKETPFTFNIKIKFYSY